MNKEIKKDKSFLIADNRRAIKNPITKSTIEEDLNTEEKNKKESEKEINIKLSSMEQYLDELLSFIRDIKNYVNDITEETFICAHYREFSHFYQLAEYSIDRFFFLQKL